MSRLWTAALLMTGVGLFLLECQSPSTAADDRTEGQSTSDVALQKEEGDNAWMQAKLTGSQKILEHLTKGDIDAVANDARRVQVMNYMEQWLTSSEIKELSEYRGQLNAFEFSTKELIRHAEDGNVDGALDAYTDMTRTCVKCHQLIRDVPDSE